jgi:hypothetical protein
VWSLALRRRRPVDSRDVDELAELIREGRVVMLGAIRQEILSGLRTEPQFRRLRDLLRAFDDVPVTHLDYEEAARCFNRCRQRGVQCSNTDFLMCAAALVHSLALFTIDNDFRRYAAILGLRLHQARDR